MTPAPTSRERALHSAIMPFPAQGQGEAARHWPVAARAGQAYTRAIATTRPAAVDYIPEADEDATVRITHRLWRLRQVVAKRKPTDEERDQAEFRSEAALDEFLATPARSPEDVVLKLKVHAEFIGTERRDHIVTAAVCDLEHLATGKAPQRSPLFSRIADVETPMTDAEGAVEALWLLVEDGKLAGKGEAVAYLASHLSEHIKEQRRLFDDLFVAAGGSVA